MVFDMFYLAEITYNIYLCLQVSLDSAYFLFAANVSSFVRSDVAQIYTLF